MDAASVILWLIALGLIVGLIALGWWQIHVHRLLDERIEKCDPTLMSSVSHKVETSTDAPAGSVVVPYTPVQAIPTNALSEQNWDTPAALPPNN